MNGVKHEILYSNEAGLAQAGEDLVIITFLSAYTDEIGLLVMVRRLVVQLLEIYPGLRMYYLEYRDEHGEEKVHLPGYELKISQVKLGVLKRLAMAMEFDDQGRRVADIDIIFPWQGGFAKISRSNICTALVPVR